MRQLPGIYAEPKGVILLAVREHNGAGEDVCGAVALKPLPLEKREGICEMKRLWVRGVSRGCGAGRLLGEAIMQVGIYLFIYMRLQALPVILSVLLSVALQRKLCACVYKLCVTTKNFMPFTGFTWYYKYCAGTVIQMLRLSNGASVAQLEENAVMIYNNQAMHDSHGVKQIGQCQLSYTLLMLTRSLQCFSTLS